MDANRIRKLSGISLNENEQLDESSSSFKNVSGMAQYFADLIVGNKTDDAAKELDKIYNANDRADNHYSSKIDDGNLNKEFYSIVNMLADKFLADVDKAFVKISKKDK